MTYTVKLEQRRVIAWAQVQYGDDGETILEPITLQIDPRLQHEVYDSIDITGFENRKIKPHTLKSMFPATGTSLMVLVLCDEKGNPVHEKYRPDEEVEYALGFYTHGSDYMPVFEEWRNEAEANPEAYFANVYMEKYGQLEEPDYEAVDEE